MSRIEKLTPKQIAKFPEYVEKWTRIGLCTDPADRETAEAGIVAAYAAANLDVPRVVWCSSPLAMALTRAVLLDKGFQGTVGASVGDSVWDSVGASVRASVGASVWDSVRASVWASVRASVGASVWASVWDSVWASVGASVWASVGDSVGASVRASVRASVCASVEDSGYGQHDANWIGFHDFFREETGLIKQTDKLQGLTTITKSAGWFLPHENICWISERHCTVHQDGQHRIHCENGPAIAYPDGWAMYAIHGVRVPWDIIEQPDSITVERIDAEQNAEVRRVMMERYGLARYLDDSGAVLLDTDETSLADPIQLYRKEIPGDEPLVMLRMLNSTPEPDQSRRTYTLRVPPDMTKALDAMAWTFGMEAKDYRPLVES